MHCTKCYFYETSVGDDVCNRCGRAYLPQANLYLGLLLFLTAAAAWTLRHLLTGSTDLLVRPPLEMGAWALWPVSIVDSPAYGLALGAWLGMLAAAPILTGLLYGKRGGWLLTIVVAVLGPSLPMAAAVALGVWIAAGWTTRLSAKLASAMLGLVPVTAYWFAATALTGYIRGDATPPADAAAGPANLVASTGVGGMMDAWRALAPALRPLIYVAPVTAVVVAAAASAAVVAVAWADRWHVRWPGSLVAVLLIGPVMALLALVGVDEIRYGMFLKRPAAAPVQTVDGKADIEQLREFLRRHPSSPHAAGIRARLAEDLERTEADVRPAGILPKAAKEMWLELLAKNPTSPLAADAHLKLGDDAARQGLFVPPPDLRKDTPDAARTPDLYAEEHYRAALARATRTEPVPEDPLTKLNVVWNMFSVGPALRARRVAEGLDAVYEQALLRLAILQDNYHKDIQDNSKALALYFVALGRKGTGSVRDALAAVREVDPKGALADNVAYDLAMLEPDLARRVDLLRGVTTAWPDTDGALLANVGAAQGLIKRSEADPEALRAAEEHLLTVQKDLKARKEKRPADYYVTMLGDRADKELIYVQAKIRAPAGKP